MIRGIGAGVILIGPPRSPREAAGCSRGKRGEEQQEEQQQDKSVPPALATPESCHTPTQLRARVHDTNAEHASRTPGAIIIIIIIIIIVVIIIIIIPGPGGDPRLPEQTILKNKEVFISIPGYFVKLPCTNPERAYPQHIRHIPCQRPLHHSTGQRWHLEH